MPLTPGSSLGHYDVTALIGEGGMGQVYRTTDTKLNRQVALKILPEAFAADPDRLARFQREAHVLATGDVTRLGLAGVSPRYVSTGHLVCAAADGSVRAVPFDAASLTVTGSPVPLLEGVSVKATGAANFSISDNERLVYAAGVGDVYARPFPGPGTEVHGLSGQGARAGVGSVGGRAVLPARR